MYNADHLKIGNPSFGIILDRILPGGFHCPDTTASKDLSFSDGSLTRASQLNGAIKTTIQLSMPALSQAQAILLRDNYSKHDLIDFTLLTAEFTKILS